MLSGANAIQYNLYKLGDATIWTTTSTQPGTGSGAAQNVPAGIYSDTVRVILTY
ncbi:spore coat protein U [Pseudomonas aeruginosa]|nr:spore coat protein U [Pseudomonas aeruginosa]VTL98027.1 spore coat protein U [Pseudomonas aeruginosa]